MSVFSDIVYAILPLFLLMACGVLVRRSGLLEREASTLLSNFALDIALPALILETLLTNKLSASYAALPVAMWAAQAVAIGLVLLGLGALRLKRGSRGAALFGVFGNTSFIGYPVTTALFPALLPATVIIDQIGMWLVLYGAMPTVSGLYGDLTDEERARRAGQSLMQRILEQVTSPLLLSLIVGLALRGLFALTGCSDLLLHSRASVLILSTLRLLGGSAIPVIMIALGMRLSAGSVAAAFARGGDARRGKVDYHADDRLLGVTLDIPFCTADLLSVSTLEAAVPPAATTVVFAIRYRLDSDLAVALFFALTVASAVTLPLMLSILR